MVTTRPLDIRAQRQIYNGGWIDVVIFDALANSGMMGVAQPLTFVEQHEDSYVADPTIRMRPDEAQQLMDELWRCGLRPTEGTGSAGSLAATERHLKDMQSVAFGLLERQGVKR